MFYNDTKYVLGYKIMIRDYIKNIYEDFKKYVDNQKVLCELKEESYFYSNHIPNYRKLYVQQLYLLRYSYAYICEYMEMYINILNYFNENKINYENWKILSIGTGSGLDLYGLGLCSEKLNYEISYSGSDVIKWEYRPEQIYKVDFVFYKDSLENILYYNDIYSKIIIFPKSIGEITDDTLVLLPNKIKSDKIYLMVSLAFNGDRSKLEVLLESFTYHGFVYTVLFNREKINKENKIELHYKYDIGIYPQDIKNFIYNLNYKCCDEVSTCSDIRDCDNKLSRYPTETDINFNYMIVEIKRI